jgi:hypothetical protein
MRNSAEVPTPAALADLVSRCNEMDRYTTELSAAEEMRIAALAAAIVSMRHILDLEEIASEKLPTRFARMDHWALTGPTIEEAETPAIRALHGALVLDEHGQVKLLTDRTWRGVWRHITLWKDGVAGVRSAELMEYLARLVGLTQRRAPQVARVLQERSEAIVGTHSLLPPGPRSSGPASAPRADAERR